MRKYTLLIMGIGLLIVIILFNYYYVYVPKVGPIGNKLPSHKDILLPTITIVITSFYAIFISILLFVKEKSPI